MTDDGDIRLDVATPDDMEDLGRRLARVLRPGDLILLTGRLGAGKTTLTRGIGEGLGVRGPVTSPTFVLARTHPNTAGGPPLVHVDAYRLGSAVELDDLDIDFGRSVVVMEWGAGLAEGLAEDRLEIEIAVRPAPDADDDLRLVALHGVGPRWAGVDLHALRTDHGHPRG